MSLAALVLALAQTRPLPPPRVLDDLDRAAGWISLLEPAAERAFAAPPEGWSSRDGEIRRAASTRVPWSWGPELGAFELEFDWRPIQAGESGDADLPFQHGRVVARVDGSALLLQEGGRVDIPASSESATFSAGPIEITRAGSSRAWRIALAPGEAPIALRALRLRDPARLPGQEVQLFDGRTLDGWRALGDAKYTVVPGEGGAGELVGEVGGGSQSFLRTEREFGNFLFEVELKNELPGNSGIQIRSHENEKGRLFGYQIEIDPSARAWSGGLYDEARRGWLDDLSDDAIARAAFRPGEWNRYRIECVGPSIRAWVNDVPTADYLDVADLSGVIGLQVHSGRDTKMRWRNFRMREFGRSSWKGPEEWRVPCMVVAGLSPRPDKSHWPIDFQKGERAKAWDSILLARAGGDLRLACSHFHRDLEGAVGDFDLAANLIAIYESVSLAGSDWTLEVELPGDWVRSASPTVGEGAKEVVILCHPPRVAVVVDGRRLDALKIEPAFRQRDMRIEAIVSLDSMDDVTRYQSLEQD